MTNTQTNTEYDTKQRNYNSVAWFYQFLAHIYSFGQIRASKLSQMSEISSGDKILYAGVGSGEDAIQAGKKGAKVTCIDLSRNMIENTRAEFIMNNVQGEFICGDIMEHNLGGHYDVVAANYFLNVFPEDAMQQLMQHLISLVRPGGKLLIADFAPADSTGIGRGIQYLNYWTAILFYWVLRLEPIHPIYNYDKYLEQYGMKVDKVQKFRIFKIGPYGYQNIIARKPS